MDPEANIKEQNSSPHDKDVAANDVAIEKRSLDGMDLQQSSVIHLTLLDRLNRWQLSIAWIGLLFVSFTNYLDAVTISTYHVYALSEYNRLSIEGAMSTIFGVIALGIQGVLATLAKNTHSFNIVAVSIALLTLACILEAASAGIGAFICGHIFYIIGLMTSKFMIFVLGSELSSVRHRSLSLGIANLPTIVSQLGGAKMAESVLESLDWRWGIGMWSIIIPILSIPLHVILFMDRRKTRQARLLAEGKQARRQRALNLWRKIIEQDLIGCVLLAAGCALFFLPIPLEHGGIDKYASAHCVAPTVIGFCVLIAFGVWEIKFAKNPLFPARLVKNRNVFGSYLTLLCGNFSLAFMAPYFYVYLQVTSQLSISNATYIVLAIPLVNSFAQLCYGSLISWMQRPKWLFVTASGLLVLGFGLQYAFYDPYSQMTGLVLSQIVAGFGAGGHLNAIVIAQASTSPEDVPVLSAAFIIISNFSGAVAGAVAGGIWTTMLILNLKKKLPEAIKDQATTIMGSLTEAQSYAWGSPEREAINVAHRDTFRLFIVGCIATSALGFLFSLIIKDIHVGQIDDERMAKKEAAEDVQNKALD